MSESTLVRWRVVVADDDAPIRALVRHTLRRDARFEPVGEARDGQEALTLVADHDPDLLLLDLDMPNLDGLGVLERLDRRPRPAVVVLTGLGEDVLAQQTLAAGARAHLTKASAFDGLTDRLAQLLDGNQLSSTEVPTRESDTDAAD
jgi:CheY-like chemotaxis protein